MLRWYVKMVIESGIVVDSLQAIASLRTCTSSKCPHRSLHADHYDTVRYGKVRREIVGWKGIELG